jgi:hypothetical protein
MSAPQFEPITEPLAAPLSGNPHDDDPEVLEDLFEIASGPPDPSAAKTDFQDHTRNVIPKPTRLQSGFQQVDANTIWPIQIQPFDPNRQRIVIRFTSGTATDYVYVADEANKCTVVASTSGQAGRLPSGIDVTLEGHNGPVFVMFGVGTGVVSWWAVTS